MHRGKIIEDLERIKTPKKIIRQIEISMKYSRAVINTGRKVTEDIKIERGTRQGDTLSTTLFIHYISGLHTKANRKHRYVKPEISTNNCIRRWHSDYHQKEETFREYISNHRTRIQRKRAGDQRIQNKEHALRQEEK